MQKIIFCVLIFIPAILSQCVTIGTTYTFSSPVISGYQYGVQSGPWITYPQVSSTGSGIADGSSGFTTNPTGQTGQFAFVQSTGNMSACVNFTDAGTYRLDWTTASRNGGGALQYNLYVYKGDFNNNPLYAAAIGHTLGNNEAFVSRTSNFTVQYAGTWNILFKGITTSDQTAYFDNIKISPINPTCQPVVYTASDFESPNVSTSNYVFGVQSGSWYTASTGPGSHTGYSGLSTGVNGYDSNGYSNGRQFVFLQHVGALTACFNFDTVGRYKLDWLDSGRVAGAGWDGNVNYYVYISASSALVTNSSYYTTSSQPWRSQSLFFDIPSSGSYTIMFIGTMIRPTQGDHTAFIDLVQISRAFITTSPLTTAIGITSAAVTSASMTTSTVNNNCLQQSPRLATFDIALGSQGYQYGETSDYWVAYSGSSSEGSGFASNASDFHASSAGISGQYAFLRGSANISTCVYFSSSQFGTYSILWTDAGRVKDQGTPDGNQDYQITVYQLPGFTPVFTSAAYSTYSGSAWLQHSEQFTISTEGNYLIAFSSMLSGDHTSYIDNIVIATFVTSQALTSHELTTAFTSSFLTTAAFTTAAFTSSEMTTSRITSASMTTSRITSAAVTSAAITTSIVQNNPATISSGLIATFESVNISNSFKYGVVGDFWVTYPRGSGDLGSGVADGSFAGGFEANSNGRTGQFAFVQGVSNISANFYFSSTQLGSWTVSWTDAGRTYANGADGYQTYNFRASQLPGNQIVYTSSSYSKSSGSVWSAQSVTFNIVSEGNYLFVFSGTTTGDHTAYIDNIKFVFNPAKISTSPLTTAPLTTAQLTTARITSAAVTTAAMTTSTLQNNPALISSGQTATFEINVGNQYRYGVVSDYWVTYESSGVADGTYLAGFQANSAGRTGQFAFIQGAANMSANFFFSSIQTGAWKISWTDSGRNLANYPSDGNNDYYIYVYALPSNQLVFTSSKYSSTSNMNWASHFETFNIASEGAYLFVFKATKTGDHTTYIDNISFVYTPTPLTTSAVISSVVTSSAVTSSPVTSAGVTSGVPSGATSSTRSTSAGSTSSSTSASSTSSSSTTSSSTSAQASTSTTKSSSTSASSTSASSTSAGSTSGFALTSAFVSSTSGSASTTSTSGRIAAVTARVAYTDSKCTQFSKAQYDVNPANTMCVASGCTFSSNSGLYIKTFCLDSTVSAITNTGISSNLSLVVQVDFSDKSCGDIETIYVILNGTCLDGQPDSRYACNNLDQLVYAEYPSSSGDCRGSPTSSSVIEDKCYNQKGGSGTRALFCRSASDASSKGFIGTAFYTDNKCTQLQRAQYLPTLYYGNETSCPEGCSSSPDKNGLYTKSFCLNSTQEGMVSRTLGRSVEIVLQAQYNGTACSQDQLAAIFVKPSGQCSSVDDGSVVLSCNGSNVLVKQYSGSSCAGSPSSTTLPDLCFKDSGNSNRYQCLPAQAPITTSSSGPNEVFSSASVLSFSVIVWALSLLF